LEDSGSDEYKVVFAGRYKVTPQVLLFPEVDVDREFHDKTLTYYTDHKRIRLDLGKVTLTGFNVEVARLPFRNGKKDGHVYRLPNDASFRWRAEGIPDPKYDTRSAWGRLSIPQRVFSVTGFLFLLGVVADVVGVIDALTP